MRINPSLAFARMPRTEARGGMATDDRGVARRVKPGGFGVVPLGFATNAPLPRERDLRFAREARGASLELKKKKGDFACRITQ